MMKLADLNLLAERRYALEAFVDRAADYLVECAQSPALDTDVDALHRGKHLLTPYINAVFYLKASLDHLAGLAIMLSDPDHLPRYGCYTVARGSLEASARAAWLLDSTVSDRERTARGMMDVAQSLWNGRELNDRSKETSDYYDDRIGEMRKDAQNAHLDWVAETKGQRKGGPRSIAEQRWPRVSDLVDDLLKHTMGTEESQRWAYRLLSGYAHADGYVLLLNTETVEVGKQGFNRVKHLLNADDLVTFVSMASFAHEWVLGLFGEAAGRPDPPDL